MSGKRHNKEDYKVVLKIYDNEVTNDQYNQLENWFKKVLFTGEYRKSTKSTVK